MIALFCRPPIRPASIRVEWPSAEGLRRSAERPRNPRATRCSGRTGDRAGRLWKSQRISLRKRPRNAPRQLTRVSSDSAPFRRAALIFGTHTIDPILTGKWNWGHRCCRMIHDVSSLGWPHTVFRNVLQSGAYANSPIFHQPCGTPRVNRPWREIPHANKS